MFSQLLIRPVFEYSWGLKSKEEKRGKKLRKLFCDSYLSCIRNQLDSQPTSIKKLNEEKTKVLVLSCLFKTSNFFEILSNKSPCMRAHCRNIISFWSVLLLFRKKKKQQTNRIYFTSHQSTKQEFHESVYQIKYGSNTVCERQSSEPELLLFHSLEFQLMSRTNIDTRCTHTNRRLWKIEYRHFAFHHFARLLIILNIVCIQRTQRWNMK